MNRKLLVLGLGLALTVGVSCTSGELPLFTENSGEVPTVPTDTVGTVPPDTSDTVPPDTSGTAPTDTTGAEPTDTTGAEPTDTTGTVPTDTTGTVPTGDGGDEWHVGLLACDPQPYAAETRMIGPTGGQISVGNHNLKIPEFALSEEVAITVEQIEGPVRSVRLSPEGLHFALPAILSLSYKECENTQHPKSIVYTDESLNILEWLPTLEVSSSSHVKTPITHFSRYAVAY